MFDPFANEEEKEVSVQPFQKLIHYEGGEEYLVVICNSNNNLYYTIQVESKYRKQK